MIRQRILYSSPLAFARRVRASCYSDFREQVGTPTGFRLFVVRATEAYAIRMPRGAQTAKILTSQAIHRAFASTSDSPVLAWLAVVRETSPEMAGEAGEHGAVLRIWLESQGETW